MGISDIIIRIRERPGHKESMQAFRQVFFDKDDIGDDEYDDVDPLTDLAYGLFNRGEISPTMKELISGSPHPEDQMNTELTFEERAAKYDITVVRKYVYKKIRREGHGKTLNQIPIKDCAIQFHANLFIPGVAEPVISTYGLNNAPAVQVKKMVRGIVAAMGSMRAEEMAEFWISSKVLFGELGNGHIPPNTDLLIIIDIKKFAEPGSHEFVNFLPNYEREHISPNRAFECALRTFEDAKALIKDGEHREAVTLLNKAKFYCEKVGRDEMDTKWFPFQALHCSIYMTLAAAYYHQQEYHSTIRLLKIAKRYLHHEIYNLHFMEGSAYEQLGAYKSALGCFKLCQKIYPCKVSIDAVARLTTKIDLIKLNTF